MAAEVSSLMRLLTRHDKDDGGSGGGGGGGGDLVTRDLLGGCGGGVAPQVEDKAELQLEVQLLSGWENRHGVMSGKACFQQRGGGGGGSGSRGRGGDRPLQDLNMPPLCSSGFLPPSRLPAPQMRSSLFQDPSAPALELMLRPSASAPPPPAEYRSVCTLEKVKSALERAQRESVRKQQQLPPAGSASPASSSTTTSSAKRRGRWGRDEEAEGESKSSSSSSSSVVVQGDDFGGATGMAAAGCPSCLLYVLISRSDPRCPRCNSAVPLPPPPPSNKRPRIDLNAAIATGAEPAAPATHYP